MNEEYLNPNLTKNRYIYNITRDWYNPETVHVHKYPIIQSNNELTYYKVPGSKVLCCINNFRILDDLDKVTNVLAENKRCCSIFCLEDPGHSYEDKQTLLSIARKKEDLIEDLKKLNLLKDGVEDVIRRKNNEKEDLIRKIALAEKGLKQISMLESEKTCTE